MSGKTSRNANHFDVQDLGIMVKIIDTIVESIIPDRIRSRHEFADTFFIRVVSFLLCLLSRLELLLGSRSFPLFLCLFLCACPSHHQALHCLHRLPS
jgi:hypothetical protein